MRIDLFNYTLPAELIAYFPPANRDGGRLMVLTPDQQTIFHSQITKLPDLLPAGSLLVVNDTRVIKARLRGTRPTGAKVEVFLVRDLDSDQTHCRFATLTKSNKPLRPGDFIQLGNLVATVSGKDDQGETVLSFAVPKAAVYDYAATWGEIPLPPYIHRPTAETDATRYQTLFAKHDGSVAAPTAGLHFSPGLLSSLREKGTEIATITLHVGPGTFRPVKAEDTDQHEMETEYYEIPEPTVRAIEKAKAQGRPVIAIGTTTTRALEGTYATNGRLISGPGSTALFITPGFKFNVVEGLMTNFHLPKSTLICLVSALAGREFVLRAYQEAVDQQYRFYSYGDAMLILPWEQP